MPRLPEYVRGGSSGVPQPYRDVQSELGLPVQLWAQVVDLLSDPNRILGCISLCSPLVISVDLSWSVSDGTTVTGTMTGTIT